MAIGIHHSNQNEFAPVFRSSFAFFTLFQIPLFSVLVKTIFYQI